MELLIWLLVMWVIFGGGSKKGRTSRNLPSKRVEKVDKPQQKEVKSSTNRQQKTVIFGDLADFLREFKELMDVENLPEIKSDEQAEQTVEPHPAFSEMSSEDIANRKRELAKKRSRRLESKKTAEQHDDECGYCTGEIEVESAIAVHSAPAEPVVLADRPKRDVAAACRELQLNPLQQAVVWTEVLDKPLALRKRK